MPGEVEAVVLDAMTKMMEVVRGLGGLFIMHLFLCFSGDGEGGAGVTVLPTV